MEKYSAYPINKVLAYRLTPYALDECCIFPYRTQMNTACISYQAIVMIIFKHLFVILNRVCPCPGHQELSTSKMIKSDFGSYYTVMIAKRNRSHF